MREGLLLFSCAALQCQLYPVNYTFVTAEVQREFEGGCSITSTNYTVCSTPSRLTDSQLGPQHNPIDNSSYYIFQGSAQNTARYYILFTFSQYVDVYNITLHYFVHNQGGTQPLVSAFGVGDDFELQLNIQQTTLATSTVVTISVPRIPPSGLNSASIQGGPIIIITSRVLLRINHGEISLSEVEFFSELQQILYVCIK